MLLVKKSLQNSLFMDVFLLKLENGSKIEKNYIAYYKRTANDTKELNEARKERSKEMIKTFYNEMHKNKLQETNTERKMSEDKKLYINERNETETETLQIYNSKKIASSKDATRKGKTKKDELKHHWIGALSNSAMAVRERFVNPILSDGIAISHSWVSNFSSHKSPVSAEKNIWSEKKDDMRTIRSTRAEMESAKRANISPKYKSKGRKSRASAITNECTIFSSPSLEEIANHVLELEEKTVNMLEPMLQPVVEGIGRNLGVAMTNVANIPNHPAVKSVIDQKYPIIEDLVEYPLVSLD